MTPSAPKETPTERANIMRAAVVSIERDEGFVSRWTQGVLADWFIGFGFDLHGIAADRLPPYPHGTITRRQAEEILEWAVDGMYSQVVSLVGDECWVRLPARTKVGLINMSYQMGVAGVSRFKRMLNHLCAGEYPLAAEEARNSQWALQTPERAARVSAMLAG